MVKIISGMREMGLSVNVNDLPYNHKDLRVQFSETM